MSAHPKGSARRRWLIPLASALAGVLSAAALVTSASAEIRTVVPYSDGGYSYKQVATNAEPGFEQPSFDASSFAEGGLAPFGSHTGLCAFYSSFRTAWAENTDMLVRRWVTLPPGTTNVAVGVAIDNRVQVFLNGTDVSGGLQEPGGCTFNDHRVFAVPDALLAAGPNLLAVRGQAAGDPNFLDLQVTADIETTAPETTITSGPPGSTTDSTPTFGFSSSEEGSGFECRVDAEPFAACSSPHTTATLGDGQHTFEVRATDQAGNTDQTPAGGTFTVDATPPQTSIASGPSGLTKDDTPSFSFGSPESGTAFECRIDGGPFFACASPYTAPSLAPGRHTLEVRALDAAGNADPTPASFAFQVAAQLEDLDAPKFAKEVNVEVASGRVLVAVAGAARAGARAAQKGLRFVPLSEARQIPTGSFLDTSRGTVRLQSSVNRSGTAQFGNFNAGLFQVLQSSKRSAKGLTDIVLKGGSFSRCGARSSGRARASARSKRTIRRVSSNARGRFRSRGRYSSATVRGTKWTTTDRCDGTLTKVTRGSVSVRDNRRRKTIVVKAGRSYLAKAPR